MCTYTNPASTPRITTRHMEDGPSWLCAHLPLRALASSYRWKNWSSERLTYLPRSHSRSSHRVRASQVLARGSGLPLPHKLPRLTAPQVDPSQKHLLPAAGGNQIIQEKPKSSRMGKKGPSRDLHQLSTSWKPRTPAVGHPSQDPGAVNPDLQFIRGVCRVWALFCLLSFSLTHRITTSTVFT